MDRMCPVKRIQSDRWWCSVVFAALCTLSDDDNLDDNSHDLRAFFKRLVGIYTVNELLGAVLKTELQWSEELQLFANKTLFEQDLLVQLANSLVVEMNRSGTEYILFLSGPIVSLCCSQICP
jgi:hypothetical protein